MVLRYEQNAWDVFPEENGRLQYLPLFFKGYIVINLSPFMGTITGIVKMINFKIHCKRLLT